MTRPLSKCNNVGMARKQTLTLEPLEFVKLAISKDNFRPILNSVLHDGDVLVGTDTHRMHLVSGVSTSEKKTLLHVGKNCDLNANPENYPNWQRVVPDEHNATFVVNGREFQEFCVQVSKFIKADKTLANRATLVLGVEPNTLEIRAVSDSVEATFKYRGSFTFSFDKDFETDCSTVKIGIDITFLIDALEVSKDDVTVSLTLTNLHNAPYTLYTARPIVFANVNPVGYKQYKAVVMPMDIR